MNRPFATLLSALLLAPVPAMAQAPAGYYVAVPEAAADKPELMTRDTPWQLRNGAYTAQRAPERDAVLCALVARSAGKLSSFTVAGKAYEPDALAKCNARAK